MISFFDVFDTLVCRRCGGPDAVLWFVGEKLQRRGLISVDASTFAKVRRSTEARLYSRKPDGPGTTIDEIYSQLERVGVVMAGCALEAQSVENAMEIDFCEPVPRMRELLDEARRIGQIVFVSDMYLRRETICEILERCELLGDNDLLLISSEEKLWKKDGGLFKRALECCGAKASDCCHYGNDRVADISGAAKVSVRSAFITQANFNQREAYWDKVGPYSNGLGSLIAGASRIVRIKLNEKYPDKAEFIEVATTVAAPPLIIFVLWLLQKAKADGIKRLFFLSRDGQILLRLAEVLAPRLGIDIDLRYLYASRQSWFLPSLLSFDKARFDWLLRARQMLSVKELLLAIGIEDREINSVPLKVPLKASAVDSGSWTKEGDALFEDSSFQGFLMKNVAVRRRDLLLYLKQSGLSLDKKSALVDLGWSGSIQRMGQAIMGMDNLPTYYFGLRNEEVPSGAVAYLDYSFQPQLEQIIQLVEGFCFADHPSVIGYYCEEGFVKPKFADSNATQAILEWGLSEFHSVVIEVASSIDCSYIHARGTFVLQETLLRYLTEVNEVPRRAEAQVLGGQPWEDGVGSLSIFSSRASPVSLADLLINQLRLFSLRNRPRAFWWPGSVCLSSKVVRFVWTVIKLSKKVFRHYKRG